VHLLSPVVDYNFVERIRKLFYDLAAEKVTVKPNFLIFFLHGSPKKYPVEEQQNPIIFAQNF
jgi:hypothetical protein